MNLQFSWVIYGLIAALSFAGMTLTIKKLLNLGLHPIILNMFLFAITFILFFGWVVFAQIEFKLTYTILGFLFLAGLFALSGNYFDVMANKLAPNPGYASALKASQIVLITMIAPFLVGASFTMQKVIGVLVVFIGVIILAI